MDESGIVHLAVLRKNHANTFRLSVTLREPLSPLLLQAALCAVTPRFPTLVAGIHPGLFRYDVVPVKQAPSIQRDDEALEVMSRRRIRECAMRVLYREEVLSVEFFHALTDGYGGAVFLKALLAEYLALAEGQCSGGQMQVLGNTFDELAETADSFAVYARSGKGGMKPSRSYLPAERRPDGSPIQTTAAVFAVDTLLQAAHRCHTTLTGFLTAVMAEALMTMQINRRGEACRPVQIMVPVNLRKLFPSRTLRNFSLYALPGICPEDMASPFEAVTSKVSRQLEQQLSSDALHTMLSANHRLLCLSRWLPLCVKIRLLRFSFWLFGGKTSSITLSNMGEFDLPAAMRPHIRRVDFLLTPRLYSDYNCGVISLHGRLVINITRRCERPELEHEFLELLRRLGCVPEPEQNETPDCGQYNFHISQTKLKQEANNRGV